MSAVTHNRDQKFDLSQALIDERRLGKRGNPVTGAPRRLDEIANEILDRLRVNGERRP